MTTPEPEFADAFQRLLAENMNRLRGRLLGMVEAVGFPPQQEKAIKSLLKSLTYDAQTELAALPTVYQPPRCQGDCGCTRSACLEK